MLSIEMWIRVVGAACRPFANVRPNCARTGENTAPGRDTCCWDLSLHGCDVPTVAT